MYTDPQSASQPRLIVNSPLEAEEQRVRKQHYAKRTAENLIAFGLIDPASVTESSSSKKRKKSVGFRTPADRTETRTKQPSSRRSQQSQATPFPALNLDHQPSTTLSKLTSSAQHHRPENSAQSAPSARSQLKELHHDEMFASRGATRRERSFKGSSCAACEEPLEHMLRGERILQLSCGHVSHEACFYEYIKEFEAQTCPECNAALGFDTSRGGNIDFENLNKLVRNIQTPITKERPRETTTTPVPWEAENPRRPSGATQPPTPARGSRDHLLPSSTFAGAHTSEQNLPSHARNTSGETGRASSTGFSEAQLGNGARHEYDVQEMEASVGVPRHTIRNPIPAPIVTVRSEFPTLNKSRHSQSLTCLVTVEVVEGKWHPHPEDMGSIPPVPSPFPGEAFATPATLPLPPKPPPVDSVHEDMGLEDVKDDLFTRVDNWHGLDYERFGRLILHGLIRVGKDRQSWQELECFLFSEMLICVKERKILSSASQQWDGPQGPTPKTKFTLKGSILIKRHLKHVESSYEDDILTLSLSVAELPAFHLQFPDRRQLDTWRKALININIPGPPIPQRHDYEHDSYATDDDETTSRPGRPTPSAHSSTYDGPRSHATAPTDYASRPGVRDLHLGTSSIHIPLDLVVVVPVSSSMHGLKMNLLRDSLRFLVSSLGERDRMGLVTFGCGIGGMPVVGMTTKSWRGWEGALNLIRPVHQKNIRADVVEGANAAMDLLMQRKSSNPLSHIILISDSPTSDPESVDFVVSRAEAAKIGVHSFGLGMTHKPDTMVEMATRTKASYTYVKDWMMLRECLAGCVGSLQSTSHQNVKLRLRLPEGSPAKFVKISGALQVTKRSTGRDAEISLGDMRFGDKRDILVQLAVQPDTTGTDSAPTDPWESIISGLEALGPMDQDDAASLSVEEIPLIQADLTWGDIQRDGNVSQLPRPSLLAITMLPPSTKKTCYSRPLTPPIPPHPSIVQRRMELLTSDMLSRALGLVARGQNDRAHHLLAETRSILKGLGKGGLPPPPTPPPRTALPPPPTPRTPGAKTPPLETSFPQPPTNKSPSPRLQPESTGPFAPASGIDKATLTALDSELESSLEWISQPAIFARDSRKAVLQAIGVISSQRGFTFRTPAEALWATRIPGIRRVSDRCREWRDGGDESLAEES